MHVESDVPVKVYVLDSEDGMHAALIRSKDGTSSDAVGGLKKDGGNASTHIVIGGVN